MRPTITSGLVDTKAKLGDDVMFKCVATGTPVPRILWLVAPLLRSSERLHQMGDGSLVLRDVRPSDAGLFSCVARNKVGEVTDSGTLTVLGEPRFIVIAMSHTGMNTWCKKIKKIKIKIKK